MMPKPPHTDTIELTPEMVEQGIREQKYARWMAQYRTGTMPDDEWQGLLADRDFCSWLASL